MSRTRLRYRILLFFCLAAFTALGQKSLLPENTALYGDSLDAILTRANNNYSTFLGGEVSRAWGKLSPDQQQVAASHINEMFNKKFSVRPHIQAYASALSSALNEAGLSGQKLDAYLNTYTQVLERGKPQRCYDLSENFKTALSKADALRGKLQCSICQ